MAAALILLMWPLRPYLHLASWYILLKLSARGFPASRIDSSLLLQSKTQHTRGSDQRRSATQEKQSPVWCWTRNPIQEFLVQHCFRTKTIPAVVQRPPVPRSPQESQLQPRVLPLLLFPMRGGQGTWRPCWRAPADLSTL